MVTVRQRQLPGRVDDILPCELRTNSREIVSTSLSKLLSGHLRYTTAPGVVVNAAIKTLLVASKQ